MLEKRRESQELGFSFECLGIQGIYRNPLLTEGMYT